MRSSGRMLYLRQRYTIKAKWIILHQVPFSSRGSDVIRFRISVVFPLLYLELFWGFSEIQDRIGLSFNIYCEME